MPTVDGKFVYAAFQKQEDKAKERQAVRYKYRAALKEIVLLKAALREVVAQQTVLEGM